MSVYLDTSVFLSAASLGHEATHLACRRLVTAVGEGRLQAVISCETLLEVLHAADWRQARAQGLELTRLVAQLFPEVRPVSATTVDLAGDLLKKNPRLGVRVSLHVAAMKELGVMDVISDDRDYGLASGIRRLSPEDACLHFRLIGATTA